MSRKLTADEMKILSQALATREDQLKRAVNTEPDEDVKALREKQLQALRKLSADIMSIDLFPESK